MAALSPEYQEILKRELLAQYVGSLPLLLPNKKPPPTDLTITARKEWICGS